MVNTFGELRALIANERLGWQPPHNMPDDAPLPVTGLGADRSGLVGANTSSPADFTGLGPGTNPYLAIERARAGLVTARQVTDAFPADTLRRLGLDEAVPGIAGRDSEAVPPAAGAPPASVDWRNRFGQNWITSVRDQNPCNSCWAFAGVALVESMVRIEHAMWTRLSEGDPRDGVGKGCADEGNMGEVSNFFANNGFCDPVSWPWHTDTRTYAPTPDRSGRSVRGPAFTWVSVSDSKNWLNAVGPLVTYIDVYDDFSGVGSGVYGAAPTRPTPTVAGICSSSSVTTTRWVPGSARTPGAPTGG